MGNIYSHRGDNKIYTWQGHASESLISDMDGHVAVKAFVICYNFYYYNLSFPEAILWKYHLNLGHFWK